jgi:hypothetical protein
MQGAIRFSHGDFWRFDMAAEHTCRFAFEGWRFDRHGFPRAP